MSSIGQIEKQTQAHVVVLFRKRLGYDYLGNRIDRDNRNIGPELGENTVTESISTPSTPVNQPGYTGESSLGSLAYWVFTVFWQNVPSVRQEYISMLEPQAEEEDVAFVPLWVFFASGYKWMGGFVGGCLGLYPTQMFTSEPLWISLVTSIVTFVGWTTGTYLDINTYINERLIK